MEEEGKVNWENKNIQKREENGKNLSLHSTQV